MKSNPYFYQDPRQALLNLKYPALASSFPVDFKPGQSPLALGLPGVEKPTTPLGFGKVISQASEKISKPDRILREVLSGKENLNTTELMLSLQESQLTLSKTIRVVNDLVKSLNNLLQLQI